MSTAPKEPVDVYDVAGYLNSKAARVVRACRARGWATDWSRRGAYLFLEVAEVIESLRGKGDSPPAEEAADVLLVYLSILGANGIDVAVVLAEMDRKLALIEAGTIGAGPDAVRVSP
ncbi:MAG TPA: hypothetical protein VFP50_15245 [Anaeromyxobacteraceae bacterium]|nr:hypothetical protein [Anaeromyxobacteraceae bacterium]